LDRNALIETNVQTALLQVPLFPAPRLLDEPQHRARLGPVAFEVLTALPGRADTLAGWLGVSTRQVLGAVGQLTVRGLALRLRGYGASGVWVRP